MLPNIERAWDEIPYFQLGDHPGRNEPGTGEINYRHIFKYLYDKGYDGIVGMEHGKSEDGLEGELKLIEAYLKARSEERRVGKECRIGLTLNDQHRIQRHLLMHT